MVPPRPEKQGLVNVLKLLPEPVPATRTWWACVSEVVSENHRSVPWTVMVASWSIPPDSPGTRQSRPLVGPYRGTFEHDVRAGALLARTHEGEGVPAARPEGHQLSPCEEVLLGPLPTAVVRVPELASRPR